MIFTIFSIPCTVTFVYVLIRVAVLIFQCRIDCSVEWILPSQTAIGLNPVYANNPIQYTLANNAIPYTTAIYW